MQYVVQSPINLNGFSYDEGELIEISANDAKDLLAVKAIQPVHIPFAENAGKEV